MPNFKKIKSGFTLVELLVVISIIGILSTLILANFNAARERGRDAQRKSDLRNIQTALRLFYNDIGRYPTSENGNIIGCFSNSPVYRACTWGEQWKDPVNNSTVYMSTLPKDPLNTSTNLVQYYYTWVDSDNYILQTCLENKSDTVCDTTGATMPNCNASSGCVYQVKP